MWHFLAESVVGTSHSSKSSPCQDACVVKVIQEEGVEYLVVAVSDGAGSASHSDIGAGIATQMFTELAEERFRTDPISPVSETELRGWYTNIRDRIIAEAQILGISHRAMACTLLTAIIGNETGTFAQLGDGVLVYRQNGQYLPVFWPQSGEYVNTTNFLTDDSYAKEVVFTEIHASFELLAAMTDGLQHLAIDYNSKLGVNGFFQPFFDRLQSVEEVSSLSQPLRELLGSPKINERTDDDKTLVLALRVNPCASA